MARVADVQCAGNCGKLMWAGSTSLPPGQAKCRDCRRTQWEHGTLNAYRRHACRCELCADANRVSFREYQRRRNAGMPGTKKCTVKDCARDHVSRGMCRMHYKRWARAKGMRQPPSDRWSDARRSNYHARRARMNGAQQSDKVMLAELLIRNPVCPECDQHIDPDLAWPEPLSASIDHTIPLSRGGAHALSNATAMHLVCNMRKGNRMQEHEDADA